MRWPLLALLAMLTQHARADSSSEHLQGDQLRGFGADLVPMRSTAVELRTQDVLLEYHDGRWFVAARYTLHLDEPRATRLGVAMVEPRCALLRDGDDCAPYKLHDFEAKVDGKPATPKRGAVPRGMQMHPYIGALWSFDVEFNPGKDATVEVRYSTRGASTPSGRDLLFYLTHPGIGWSGVVGNVRFTVRVPAYALSIEDTPGLQLTAMQQQSPNDDEPYVESIYRASNWLPRPELGFGFGTELPLAAFHVAPDAAERAEIAPDDVCPPRFNEQKQLSDAQIGQCVNLIYAAFGRHFQNKKLEAYYYADPFQWRLAKEAPDDTSKRWVRGLREMPGFKPQWISSADRMRLLDGLLEKQRSRGGRKADAARLSDAAKADPRCCLDVREFYRRLRQAILADDMRTTANLARFPFELRGAVHSDLPTIQRGQFLLGFPRALKQLDVGEHGDAPISMKKYLRENPEFDAKWLQGEDTARIGNLELKRRDGSWSLRAIYADHWAAQGYELR